MNGLTCSIPAAYLSSTSVVRLVPLVTQSPQFISLANGSRYVFGNAENITGRTQQVGSQPAQHLPDVLEMVFYGHGPDTDCAMTSANGAQGTIVVQVPLQNGTFDLPIATYHVSP